MTDAGLEIAPGGEEPPADEPGSRKGPRKRRWPGCLAALIALAVLVGGFWFAIDRGVDLLRAQFDDAQDYSGPGSGQVLVEVEEGDSVAAIGRTLKSEGVVASVTAFTNAAANEDGASNIQPGHYELREEMPAADALDMLMDPENVVRTSVTIPEGFRVDQVTERLAEETDFGRGRFRRVLENRVDALGLPPYAQGDPEGFLFPATYDFEPGTKPAQMLKQMVDQYKSVAQEVPVGQASSVDLDRRQLVTVASIIEKEVSRSEDFPAVAEVIYNRLDGTCASEGVPEGLLQMDSTVHFLSGGGSGSVFTDSEARESDSPYNTYRQTGLPPGPIASPGKEALQAALAPTEEGYCYFVAVDLDSGETAFASTEGEHADNVERLREWCRENEGRC